MNIIVAADENWAIGNKNELLVRIPADQKFFRETTMGKVVVMGRKTLETFPNGLPLMGRTNIVLTHDKNDVRAFILSILFLSLHCCRRDKREQDKPQREFVFHRFLYQMNN